jgi:predicted kinase
VELPVPSTDLPDRNQPDADIHRPAGRSGAGDLSRRLAALATAHPSAPGYAEGRARLSDQPGQRGDDAVPDAVERRQHKPGDADADLDEVRLAEPSRLATDARHAERTIEVQATLAEAKKAGLATDRQHTTDDRQKIWSRERVALQEKIVNDLYAESAAVPCEGRAIVAGGLPGAGKTTVLTRQAGIDRSRYLMINPDGIKEAMASRSMVPEVKGLTPMEASDLVHEESSLIAKRLAMRAYADGKNVVWDITMSSSDTTQRRITDLRAAGYTNVEGIFVDIPIEVSVRRAHARHRQGHEDFIAGRGYGGRCITPEVIRAQADPDYGSTNRRTFEQIKSGLDYWRLYDNSVDGNEAVLAEEAKPRHHEPEEASR